AGRREAGAVSRAARGRCRGLRAARHRCARRAVRSRAPPQACARDHRSGAGTGAAMSLDDALRAQLGRTLDSTPFRTIRGRSLERYDGKVRDCFIDSEHRERIIIVTDRLSAFDAVVGTIPFKGQVLNQLAQFWFAKTAQIAANHMVAVPDPN